MLGKNIKFEHIKREHEARVRSFDEFQEAQAFRARQRFQALEMALRPREYADRLAWLDSRICPGTAKWLEKDATFCQWIDMSSPLMKLLWIRGIPGAGEFSRVSTECYKITC